MQQESWSNVTKSLELQRKKDDSLKNHQVVILAFTL